MPCILNYASRKIEVSKMNRKMTIKKLTFVALVLMSLVVIISPTLAAASSGSNNAKNAMMQMTTALENSDTTLQWNYAEYIVDGRGITFGIIGFCTGTYDGNVLIKHYSTLNPNNNLAKYIPALDAIDAAPHTAADGDGNPSTAGLNNFINDVKNCNDPLFKQAQLNQLDQLYYNPAVSIANNIGAKNCLTLAFIYDMCVRHGSNGAQAIVNSATSSLGGTPKTGINENTYLSKLISLRDAELKSEGLGDVDRDTGFKNILTSGNVDLVMPFTFVAYGDTFTIDGDIGIDTSSSDGSIIPTPTPTPIVASPVAVFSAYPTSGRSPLTVTFTDKSIGSPTSCQWNFGDGQNQQPRTRRINIPELENRPLAR